MGVGDFVAVFQVANKIYQQIKDSPEQYRAIAIELNNLLNALQSFKIGILTDLEKTSTSLHQILTEFQKVLGELQKELEKYHGLENASKSISGITLTLIHKLKWDEKKIEYYRSRINSHITLLNAFNINLVRNDILTIGDGVNQLKKYEEDRTRRQEHQEITEWLTHIDYGLEQTGFIRTRQIETGEWFINSAELQTWISTKDSTLYCPGIPGSGKTIITSIVVDHLLTKYEDDPTTGVAYLYCNFQKQRDQTVDLLLLSLLKQFSQKLLCIPTNIQQLYECHKARQSRPSSDEIKKSLQDTIQLYTRVFIIIDALDECLTEEREKLLPVIFNIQKQDKSQVNLFATSRFVPEIISRFEGLMQKEIWADGGDVRRYIDARMPYLLHSYISRYPELQDTIRTEIMKATSGMFLLAILHMDSLSDKSTRGDIKLALKNMPQGPEGLDTVYERALNRISSQEKDFALLAKKVLVWVTHAKRSLTTAELQHALTVRIGMEDLDEDFLPEVDVLVSICAGLVMIDGQRGIIRWIHYTTQEYFERTWRTWAPQAQEEIATTCLAYLSFSVFSQGCSLTDEEFDERLKSYHLYDYAARNWGYHAVKAEASMNLEQAILKTLTDHTKLSSSTQAMFAQRDYGGYSQRFPRNVTGPHLAAYFGLTEIMRVLINSGHDADIKDSLGRTPLSWAARNGHQAVAKLLVAKAGLDPDSKDRRSRTPLSWAAEKGYGPVAKILLEKESVDPDSKDKYSRTPLSWSAANGHEAVVTLLLAKNAVDPNSKDKYGRTPLLWAAREGNLASVNLLLAKAATDPDSKDIYSRTPLSWAAENGHEVIVIALLAREAVLPDSRDDDGATPLSWAAENGHERVVGLLLSNKRVDPNSKDSSGATPLSWAILNKHESVVKLLQSHLEKAGISSIVNTSCG